MNDRDLPEGGWTNEGFVIYDDDGEVALKAQKPIPNLE